MYWILATTFIVIALAVPRLRPLGIAGCIVLGLLLGWGVLQRLGGPASPPAPTQQERGRPGSPARVSEAITPDAVRVEGLQLTGGGAPFELRGRIENTATNLLLKSVTFRLTRRDCYPGALDPSGCAILWQDQHWVAVTIPPGEAREFASSIWVRGAAPRARGTTHDTFEVVAASGEPLAREQADSRQD